VNKINENWDCIKYESRDTNTLQWY